MYLQIIYNIMVNQKNKKAVCLQKAQINRNRVSVIAKVESERGEIVWKDLKE